MIFRSGIWLGLRGFITSAVVSVSLLGIGVLVSASAGAILLATDSLGPILDFESAPAHAAPSSDLLSASLTPTPFQPEPFRTVSWNSVGDLPNSITAITESNTPISEIAFSPTDVQSVAAAQTDMPTADTETLAETQISSSTPTKLKYIPPRPTATRTNTRRPVVMNTATATQKSIQPKIVETASHTPTPTELPTEVDTPEIPTQTQITEALPSDATPIVGDVTSTSIAPSPTPTNTPTRIPPTATGKPSNTSAPSATSSGCQVVYNTDYENRVLALINDQRSAVGLKALARNSALDSEARTHSIDQAVHNFLSHTGSDGSTFWQRAVRAGYTGHWGGEIIYSGGGAYGTPDQAIKWWMNSAPHKAMIVGDLDDFGAGYAYCPTSGWGGFITVGFGHR
jgi:uncharacterized protein YkwD